MEQFQRLFNHTMLLITNPMFLFFIVLQTNFPKLTQAKNAKAEHSYKHRFTFFLFFIYCMEHKRCTMAHASEKLRRKPDKYEFYIGLMSWTLEVASLQNDTLLTGNCKKSVSINKSGWFSN